MTVTVTGTGDAPATPLVPEPPRVETRTVIATPPPAPPPAPVPPIEPAASIDLAKEARIRGRAVFDGRIPRRRRIDTWRATGATVYDESEVVHRENRGIRSVFVYVREVEGTFEVPREVVELSFCDFRIGPHVVGARAGQGVAVTNLHPETQNLHALPKRSKEMNITMRPGQRDVLRFESAEVMVPLRCDIHPWERAYVGVLDHPYFSVTDDNGAFELPAIGPGEYVLLAWHEVYGTLERRVLVAERTDSVEFIFVRR